MIFQLTPGKTLIFLFLWVYAFGGLAVAQTVESAIGELTATPWLVTVEGETRTRTMRFKTISKASETLYVVTGTYGWSDLIPLPAEIKFSQGKQGLELTLTNPTSYSVIKASQKSDFLFEGTFTLPAGEPKQVAIRKVTEADLVVLIAEAKNPIKKPATTVPAACASFSGGWGGPWSNNGPTDMKLWVASVDDECKVRFLYIESKKTEPPTGGYWVGEIKDGSFSFTCGGGKGICSFQRKDDEIRAYYNSSVDGNNSAVFKKIK